jgi:drug/metabolite transporter (DMT)-like permease
MERRSHMDGQGAAIMIAFAATLAVNQVVVKLTNAGLQPVFQTGVRSLIGLAALMLWMRWRGIRWHITPGTVRSGILMGLVFSGEFVFLFQALDLTTVGRSSVIFYSMPVWLALAGHFLLPAERMSLTKAIGLALAMAGVIWAMLDRGAGVGNWKGDLFALVAAMNWAAIALISRITPLAQEKIEMQLWWQLAISALVLLALSPLFGPFRRDFNVLHGVSVLGQGVIVVFAMFLLWFRMIKLYPASSIASFSFLSPIFGVLMGWLLLGEPLGRGVLVALGLVACGLVLINWPRRSA